MDSGSSNLAVAAKSGLTTSFFDSDASSTTLSSGSDFSVTYTVGAVFDMGPVLILCKQKGSIISNRIRDVVSFANLNETVEMEVEFGAIYKESEFFRTFFGQ